MAHDRMQNEDLDRKMGRAGQDEDLGKQDFGKDTPGRNPQYDQQTGQKAGQKNKPINTEEEDDFGVGGGSVGNRQNK